MDLAKPLSNVFSGNQISTYISIGLFAIIGLCVLVQAFSGLRKGALYQGIKSGATLLAAITAFILTEVACNYIFGICDGKSVEEVLSSYDGVASTLGISNFDDVKGVLGNFKPLVFEYILALVFSPLLAPIVFLLLFLVLNLFFKLIAFIIRLVLHVRKGGGPTSRLIGVGIGIVHGFIFAAILLLPITVVGDLADTVITAEIEASGDKELEAVYDEDVSKVTKSPALGAVKALGGKAVLNAFGTVKNDETKFNAREELFSLAEKAPREISSLSKFNIESMSEKEKAAISSLIDLIGDSEFLSTVTSGALEGVANATQTGDIKIKAEGSTQQLVDTALTIFSTSTKDNIKKDLTSLADIFFILSDNGVITALNDGSDLSKLLTQKDENGQTVLKQVTSIIDENKRFAPLETTLVEISLSMLATELPGGQTVSKETYENVKTEFKDIIALEKPAKEDEEAYNEYLGNVSSSINETLAKENIVLEQEIVDNMAVYVADNYGGAETELTDEEFNDIMLNYYDSYLAYIENPEGAEPPAPPIPPEPQPEQ